MPVAARIPLRGLPGPAHCALHVALLDPGGHRALRQACLRRSGGQSVEPVVEVDRGGGGDVARQLHQLLIELAQRCFTLLVADDDVVDGGVADNPGEFLLLLCQQRLDAMRGALADQDDENMGGFQCIPELYRTYDTWKLTQPADRNHFQPDTTGFDMVKVKMNAGDLLIFNSLLAHGIRPNRSENKVRIAQYISMMPAQEDNETLREWRINSWKDKIAPEGYAFPGDPREWEKTKYGTAELSELGKKLLGLEKW